MKISKPDGRSGETKLFFKGIINHYGKEFGMTSIIKQLKVVRQ
jgi:hypothetical protein